MIPDPTEPIKEILLHAVPLIDALSRALLLHRQRMSEGVDGEIVGDIFDLELVGIADGLRLQLAALDAALDMHHETQLRQRAILRLSAPPPPTNPPSSALSN